MPPVEALEREDEVGEEEVREEEAREEEEVAEEEAGAEELTGEATELELEEEIGLVQMLGAPAQV